MIADSNVSLIENKLRRKPSHPIMFWSNKFIFVLQFDACTVSEWCISFFLILANDLDLF